MAARGRTARETGPSADEPLYCATFRREMQLENSFQVGAPPERVFEYLLDINKVVGCVPGAELSEVVDQTTFKGKVKVKVGPITVAYSGTARISDRNDEERRATLSAEGRETTGPGSARATAQMHVQTAGEDSLVQIVTEYHVAGRVAQFAVDPDVRLGPALARDPEHRDRGVDDRKEAGLHEYLVVHRGIGRGRKFGRPGHHEACGLEHHVPPHHLRHLVGGRRLGLYA